MHVCVRANEGQRKLDKTQANKRDERHASCHHRREISQSEHPVENVAGMRDRRAKSVAGNFQRKKSCDAYAIGLRGRHVSDKQGQRHHIAKIACADLPPMQKLGNTRELAQRVHQHANEQEYDACCQQLVSSYMLYYVK